MPGSRNGEVFEAIVIGTGFAGAVTAARLVQAGQQICVLERGRRFDPYDFPMYPNAESLQRIDGGKAADTEAPDLARWFWRIDQGLYDVRELGGVVAVQAAGYGGGSLIYTNVHLRAPADVFEQGWPAEIQRDALDPFYDLAAYMLDVRPMPVRVAKTQQLQQAAEKLGRGNEWFRPPLAVHFGEEQEKNDWGRKVGKCDLRGQCWLGCREQAKNTLDRNYLAIVEDAAMNGSPLADIRTLAEALSIERREGDGGMRFAVHYRDLLLASPDAAPKTEEVCAKAVFLCAGAVNTTELLLNSPDLLTREIKRRVGSRYHANCDSLAAVFDCDQPQEADLGPSVTSALLYRGQTDLWALEFVTGTKALAGGAKVPSQGGDEVRCGDRLLRLVHEPLFDFGDFATPDSRGMLVVDGKGADCLDKEELTGGAGKPSLGRLVADARRLEDWLLVEDGGYPTDFEPLFGILRSPLWLRRNRFLVPDSAEGSCSAAPPPRPAGGQVPDSSEGSGRAAQLRRPAGRAEQSRFPLPTALTAIRGLPKRPARMSAAQSSGGAPPFASVLAGAQPLSVTLDSLLPDWLRDALADERENFADALAPLIGPFIEKFLDDLAAQLNRRLDVTVLKEHFGDSIMAQIGTLDDDRERRKLIHGLLRQGVQVLWGSEVALAQRVNNLLLDRLPSDVQGWADVLAPLLGWLMQYRRGDGRTAVLLIMGRDRYRARLDQRPDGSLTVRMPAGLLNSSRLVQERLARDIAKEWNGELRTNPAPIFLKRQITMHSQGGCPMTSDPSTRVTESNGEVVGCPGLYVMDAAAFPTPVGVNPSATILAIAEYKIERYVDKPEDAPSRDPAVNEWLQRLGGEVPRAASEAMRSPLEHARAVLDPLPQAKPPSLEVKPVGLTFGEVMSGLLSNYRAGRPIDWGKPGPFDPRRTASFERAERLGGRVGSVIEMDLTATIGDLDLFLRLQRQGKREGVPLEGTVTFKKEGEEKGGKVCAKQSRMWFFVQVPEAANARPVQFLRYSVAFKSGPRSMRIEAAKVLRDDSRFDVWYDLTTLYFDLFEDGAPHRRGIMRLTPDDFVERQLRSIAVTPNDVDPSRKSMAYAAFAQYFLGEVAGIYLQRTDLIREVLRNVIGASQRD